MQMGAYDHHTILRMPPEKKKMTNNSNDCNPTAKNHSCETDQNISRLS
jgi:hypothetical protein